MVLVCVGGYWNNGWGNTGSVASLSLFFFMSIMLRVEDGSFAFSCRRVDSSSFFLSVFFWFSSFILSLFSPLFFHKFHSYLQGMK